MPGQMLLTDTEIEVLYERTIGGLERDDPRWMRGCIRTTRRALEAITLQDAIRILERDGWEYATESAMKLRGMNPCPMCKGRGVVE